MCVGAAWGVGETLLATVPSVSLYLEGPRRETGIFWSFCQSLNTPEALMSPEDQVGFQGWADIQPYVPTLE